MPVVLSIARKYYGSRGKVEAHSKGFRRKENLDQRLGKQDLDQLFDDRQKTTMVDGNAS